MLQILWLGLMYQVYLVLEDNKPVGVITKTDICRMVAAEMLVPA